MIKKTLILLLIPLSVLSQPNFFGTHREGNIPDTIPEEPIYMNLPEVHTDSVINHVITPFIFIIEGSTYYEGNYPIISRGIVYSKTSNPTLSNNKVEATIEQTGSFTVELSDSLDMGSAYYVRAYATNANGTVYGEQKSFSVALGGPELGYLYLIFGAKDDHTIPYSISFFLQILNEGFSDVTEMGFVLTNELSKAPTINDIKVIAPEHPDIEGTISYKEPAHSILLAENLKYNIRAYAKNSIGIRYSGLRTLDFGDISDTCGQNISSHTHDGYGLWPEKYIIDFNAQIGIVTVNLPSQPSTAQKPYLLRVVYENHIVSNTGWIGHYDYDYGGSKRQEMINLMNVKGKDVDGSSLPNLSKYPDDGYPRIRPIILLPKVTFYKGSRDSRYAIVQAFHFNAYHSFDITCPE